GRRAVWSALNPNSYRTVLAESGGTNLVTALLSGTPAAKLLTRIQRQIVALERAWYRAHCELLNARESVKREEDEAFDAFLDRTCTSYSVAQLASFPEAQKRPQPKTPACPALRTARKSRDPPMKPLCDLSPLSALF